jgi:uncharacterized protein YjbJ (UPF0337 family)
MNWDQMEGKWKQLKGSIREKFGKLTDDDLAQINGNRDKFVGIIQERYGIAREEAQRRADEWAKALRAESEAPRTSTSRP